MESYAWGIHVVLRMFPFSHGNVIKYFPLIERGLDKYGLRDSRLRLVAYATIAAESAGFLPIKEGESRFNTLKLPHELVGIGDAAKYNLYDLRMGNSGEGEKYMGRGFVQLTGKNNYIKYGNIIGRNLAAEPNLACEAAVAAEILAAYVRTNQSAITNAIRSGNLRGARRAVNGGLNGLDAFASAYKKGLSMILPKDSPAFGSIA